MIDIILMAFGVILVLTLDICVILIAVWLFLHCCIKYRHLKDWYFR